MDKKGHETLLEAFNNFHHTDKDSSMPEPILHHLENIARTGDPCIEWSILKPVIKRHFEIIVDDYERKKTNKDDSSKWEPNVEEFNLEKSRLDLLDLLESLNETPFTIQRICELLISPHIYYERCDKFMRGFEKNLRVISSCEVSQSNNQQEVENASEVDTFEMPALPKKIEDEDMPAEVKDEISEPSTSNDKNCNIDYMITDDTPVSAPGDGQ